MSAKGNPYDNAFMESFYKTLKYEEVHLWNYETWSSHLIVLRVDALENIEISRKSDFARERFPDGVYTGLRRRYADVVINDQVFGLSAPCDLSQGGGACVIGRCRVSGIIVQPIDFMKEKVTAVARGDDRVYGNGVARNDDRPIIRLNAISK